MNELKELITDFFIKKSSHHEIYLTGGTIRDILLNRPINDLDLTLPIDPTPLCREFAQIIKGNLVTLDEKEKTIRVIKDRFIFDFSPFRNNTRTIEDDLHFRDFTINSLALNIKAQPDLLLSLLGLKNHIEIEKEFIIDPLGGLNDLRAGIIRATEHNLVDDPLRLLRAFRFAATLNFTIEEATLSLIKRHAKKITQVASERITYELDKILLTPRAGDTFGKLDEVGLLSTIIPELEFMRGVEQPGYHHLDVLNHSIFALKKLDSLIEDSFSRFSRPDVIKKWIDEGQNNLIVKWGILLHDIGKPKCKRILSDSRVTFYRHDIVGSILIERIGKRLRWSNERIKGVQKLVRFHMRPFHLINTIKQGGPTNRALRRLIKEVGEDYPGLFLLSMADEMAGCGPLKPADLHEKLDQVWTKTHEFYMENMEILTKKIRLLDGFDIQKILSIGPGPLVGKALNALEEAQVEGLVTSKDEAIEWIKKWYEKNLIKSPSSMGV